MSLEVGFVGILVALESWTTLYKIQGTLYAAVEVGLVEFAALHTSYNRIELLVLARLQHVVTSPHLLGTVLATKPVGHHRTLIAPLIAQNGSHEVFTLRGIDTIDVVV